MNLSEREDYLKEKFLGKRCCHRSASYGTETIGRGKDKTVNIGSKSGVFKKVEMVEMTSGPPSGWTWSARLWFVDGTFTDFSKMGEIEVRKLTCGDCQHWNEREIKQYSLGPKVTRVGDCFKSSFAKAFGKQTTGPDQICKAFVKKVSE